MSEAVFGLIGVVVGSLLTWAKEIRSEARSRERSARYLAVRVVCIPARKLGEWDPRSELKKKIEEIERRREPKEKSEASA